jgi:VWFA-related protein
MATRRGALRLEAAASCGMRSLFFNILLLFALVLPAAPRQASMPSPVRLDVVVRDKSGAPAANLQQQDFTIIDNKQPQKILSFEAIGTSGAKANVQVILVMDEVNIGFTRVSYAREQIKRFLRQDAGKLAAPTSIDFFSDSGLSIASTPTPDGNALVEYLDKHPAHLRTTRRSQGFYGASDRLKLSIHALEQLAAYEAKQPGRKIVIWISPGWPLLSGPSVQLSSKDQQSIFDMIVGVSADLRSAHIALYAVDPLGTTDAGSFRIFYYEQFLKGVTSPSGAVLGNLALQVLAVQSGGRVVNSNNDVAALVESCMRDASAYYVLSYKPPAADGPNEYHSIEVKLDRPALKAQTRTGYYAQPAVSHTP